MASTRARIALDAMGGDDAPAAIVAGAIQAQTELTDVDVILVGDPEQIQACLNQHPNPPKLEIVPAEGTIGMDEEPLSALRRKPKASINVAMQLVKEGKADAVVSAGHSGAAMAAALLRLGRLRGIDRPAIAAIFPLPVDTASIAHDHLNYAITWFSLAFVWLGMTALLVWRIRRRTV